MVGPWARSVRSANESRGGGQAEVQAGDRRSAIESARQALSALIGGILTQALFGAGNTRFVMLVELVLHFFCPGPPALAVWHHASPGPAGELGLGRDLRAAAHGRVDLEVPSRRLEDD